MSEWPTVAIGDVTRIIGGGTPTRSNSDYYNGSIPWVTPKDMKCWNINDTQIRITEFGLKNSTARLASTNSILIVVRSGVLKHTVPVAINRLPVAINQDMKALICQDSIDPNYLARFIKGRSKEILQWVRATTADNFPIDNLKRLHVPLPPIGEQKRIAQILDSADALHAKRSKAVTLLDNLAQSIFLDMFGDQRELYSRWSIEKLGNLLDFLTSGSRGWAKYYTDEPGNLFLRIQNVRRNELILQDVAYVAPPRTAEAQRTRVQSGDVLLSITADLGRTAVIPAGIGKAFINQHLSILRCAKLNPDFLSAYLSSPAGQEKILGRNRQAVKAGLNFDDVRSLLTPCPPRELQDEFSRRLASTRVIQEVQRTHLAELDALFASLQYRAFRGEL